MIVRLSVQNDWTDFALSMDTNFLIERIGLELKKKNSPIISGGLGNPLIYYNSIINYLEEVTLSLYIIKDDIPSVDSFNQFNKMYAIPDILVLEISHRKSNMDKPLQFTFDKYIYKLDSIVLRDTGAEHFSAYITLNKKGYAFDGKSFNRLDYFAWKRKINANLEFKWEKEKFNFKEGLQMLFYYRIK